LPTVNIQLSLNTSVTSRLIADPWSEALLMIDEPQPNAQNPCILTNPNLFDQSASCPITGVGNGLGTYNGSLGRQNIFSGRTFGTNSHIWQG
jgi:hypothetical protein